MNLYILYFHGDIKKRELYYYKNYYISIIILPNNLQLLFALIYSIDIYPYNAVLGI